MTHSPQLGDVQSPCCLCVSSRSRSQLKVKYLTNKYYTFCRVRSITPLLMEGFPSNLNDTFTSTRGCAEPMLPMCQLKVKVTIKCQILKQTNIRHYVMSSLKTLYQWKDFLGCAEPMLPMCQLKVKVTVKGQILNKQILDIMSCPLYKPYTNGRFSFKLE